MRPRRDDRRSRTKTGGRRVNEQNKDAFRPDALRYRIRAEIRMAHVVADLEQAMQSAGTLAHSSNREAPQWPEYAGIRARIQVLWREAAQIRDELEGLKEP